MLDAPRRRLAAADFHHHPRPGAAARRQERRPAAAANAAGLGRQRAARRDACAQVPIDTNEGTWMNVDVCPDGRTIAFDMLGDIYTMPIAGGTPRRLTSGLAFDHAAALLARRAAASPSPRTAAAATISG